MILNARKDWEIDYSPEVAEARAMGLPIVALESTLVSHGLPFPTNLETALAAEKVVREAGAIPATIAIMAGRIKVGLSAKELEFLATSQDFHKVSTRDIAVAIVQKHNAGTTVSATMQIMQQAGISVFATGGIGGVHRLPARRLDISTDLFELSRLNQIVVCAGAKNILDLPNTLEVLESYAVLVLGFQTAKFPGFYIRDTGLTVSAQVDSAQEVAEIFSLHKTSALLVTLPIAEEYAIKPQEFQSWLQDAEEAAETHNISGAALTPFLLKFLATHSNGRTLQANQALIVANAALAAQIACENGKNRANPQS
jgi:pseudouridylate synthase